MPFLTREQLLGVSDLEVEAIPGPGGQGEIGIRLLTGAERDWLVEQFTAAQEQTGGQLKQFQPLVCALGFCDEEGGRLFTTDEVAALAEKSALFLADAAQRILKKNKLDSTDVVAEEKKEADAPSTASGSSLPGPLDAP